MKNIKDFLIKKLGGYTHEEIEAKNQIIKRLFDMEVNFNGLRKNLVESFNELITVINQNHDIDDADDVIIRMDKDYLARKVDSLRTDIAFISGLQSEDFDSIIDDNFKLKSIYDNE